MELKTLREFPEYWFLYGRCYVCSTIVEVNMNFNSNEIMMMARSDDQHNKNCPTCRTEKAIKLYRKNTKKGKEILDIYNQIIKEKEEDNYEEY